MRQSGAPDAELAEAWDRIGHYYAQRHKWAKAATYFTQVRPQGPATRFHLCQGLHNGPGPIFPSALNEQAVVLSNASCASQLHGAANHHQ